MASHRIDSTAPVLIASLMMRRCSSSGTLDRPNTPAASRASAIWCRPEQRSTKPMMVCGRTGHCIRLERRMPKGVADRSERQDGFGHDIPLDLVGTGVDRRCPVIEIERHGGDAVVWRHGRLIVAELSRLGLEGGRIPGERLDSQVIEDLQRLTATDLHLRGHGAGVAALAEV